MFSPATTDINPAYLGNRVKRLVAFCIDIFPINFIAIMVYRQFYEYDSLMESYAADPNNEEIKEAVFAVINKIGMIGGVIYLIYCFLMEASVHQATFGKKLMRLKVISIDGTTVSIQEAFWRNAFKILSHALFSIGFFWILFDRQKRGWHDIMGKTFVVDSSYDSEVSKEQIEQQYSEQKLQPKTYYTGVPTKSISHTLKEGNQTNLLYPADISSKEFKLIKLNNPDPKSRLIQYQMHLNDAVIAGNLNVDDELLWNNSTYGQKLLRVFTLFESHANRDEVMSFLFHSGEYTYAMVGVLKELKIAPLLSDYMLVVEELRQKMHIYSAQRKIFQSPLATDKERNDAYDTVNEAIESPKKIDAYYKDEVFQQQYAQKVCDYIESNPHMFIRTN